MLLDMFLVIVLLLFVVLLFCKCCLYLHIMLVDNLFVKYILSLLSLILLLILIQNILQTFLLLHHLQNLITSIFLLLKTSHDMSHLLVSTLLYKPFFLVGYGVFLLTFFLDIHYPIKEFFLLFLLSN